MSTKTENINLSLDNIITIILLSILGFLILKLNPTLPKLQTFPTLLPKLCNYLNPNNVEGFQLGSSYSKFNNSY